MCEAENVEANVLEELVGRFDYDVRRDSALGGLWARLS